MDDLPENLLYEGVSIDIAFGQARPTFGDLYLICGEQHPRFPPGGAFQFESLAQLQFEQIDDYFGIRALEDEGDDVPIWLYPLIKGNPVHHHPGPFEGLRLDYNILRNPIRRADHYLRCVEAFSSFGVQTTYRNRLATLDTPSALSQVRADIAAVVQYWANRQIVVGTSRALRVDY